MPSSETHESSKPHDMPSLPTMRGERSVDGHGTISERDSRELANYNYSPETAQRCRIVLLADSAWSDFAIADQVGVSTETVLQWKQRFAAEGIAGLIGWPATSGAALGHRRRNGDAEIIRTSLAESAANPSRSATAREVAEQANVGVTIVVRAWRQYGITPHRAGGWMFYISPGTSHGPPLADSLRSQHDSGQRCRWLN
jgi:transposase